MAETLARRADPKALWPEAKSVVMLALNYGPSEDPLAATERREVGAISVYARHRDYHDVIKGRLKTLAAWLVANAGEGADVKVFVDTAPVMEKPLAAAAGLGWQGKHTNLVSREFGSWLFLGAIFVNFELAARPARARPLRKLPRLSRRLPDRRLARALSARCAPLHFLSDDRTQRTDPERAENRDRQPHLRLRRLSGRLPVEQVRANRTRSQAFGALRSRRSAARRTRRPRRAQNFAKNSPAGRSSESATRGSCET